MGFVVGGFIMAFHIASYILDGPKFPFLGNLKHPFTKFCVNNSIIPSIFNIVYIYHFVSFQIKNGEDEPIRIVILVIAYLIGVMAMVIFLFAYFRLTNKDIFKLLADNLEKRLKKVKITRANVLKRLSDSKKKVSPISYYFNSFMKLKRVDQIVHQYDREAIMRVFDQNHLNSIVIQSVIFVVIILLGVFRDNPVFQIPAAASAVLLFTILVMFFGAFTFWMRDWAVPGAILLILGVNFLASHPIFDRPNEAYGIVYDGPRASYNLDAIAALNHPDTLTKDLSATLQILEKWRAKFPQDQSPKLVLIATSGGGQRAALWTMRVLQTADSISESSLMKHTALMTGASGGLIGAAYYRELYRQAQMGEIPSAYAPSYLRKIGADNLNPIIFTAVVNDLFIRYQYFHYAGRDYLKDRGFAFEQQLNKNTDFVLDKPISAYQEEESEAKIPLLFITPTITNDGRKLFISPHRLSFMTSFGYGDRLGNEKLQGIDFGRFFQNQDAGSLRFSSALRMAASFPYITPNVELPSEPVIEIMDSGYSDNFGVQDALRFVHVFQDWISENTSGVVMITIRDSEKVTEIEKNMSTSLFQKIFTPLRSIYINWDNVQTLNNEVAINYVPQWLNAPFERIEFEYSTRRIVEQNNPKGTESEKQLAEEIERASLNWRLTAGEKRSILESIYLPTNQESLRRLKEILVD